MGNMCGLKTLVAYKSIENDSFDQVSWERSKDYCNAVGMQLLERDEIKDLSWISKQLISQSTSFSNRIIILH
jgi:hypothetical protein